MRDDLSCDSRVKRAAECAKRALDQRMPHPQELEDGLAGFFGPSAVVLLIPLKNLDKVFQRRRKIAGTNSSSTSQVFIPNFGFG